MSMQVCMGALLRCSFGLTPCQLVVLPQNRVLVGAMPAANIMDSKPLVNVPTFGMCRSPANPVVIAATAAAAGVLTPMPCLPATAAPWVIGAPTALIGGMPALNDQSKLICTWGGIIEAATPGQFTVQLP